MNLIELLEILGGFIGIIAIIIVIWDHFKDDRRLTKYVNGFYEEIEKLILSVYKRSTESNLELVESLKEVGEPKYHQAKVEQYFDEYSKYLGLTKTKALNNRRREVNAYINQNGYLLLEDGWLKQKQFQAEDRYVTGSHTYDRSTFIEINKFLQQLRNYWKQNYSKLLFRPALKPKLPIFK